MNSPANWLEVLNWIGPLALEVVLVIGAAAGLQVITRSAIWRRTIWQVCFLSLLVLIGLDVSGLTRRTALWIIQPRPAPAELNRNPSAVGDGTKAIPHVDPIITAEPRGTVSLGSLERQNLLSSPTPQSALPNRIPNQTPSAPAPRPSRSFTDVDPALEAPNGDAKDEADAANPLLLAFGFLWLAGAGLMGGRTCLARLLYGSFHRCRAITDPVLQNRVREVAAKLAFRAVPRLVECSRSPGPIAFGFLRPVIGLPKNFMREFTPEEQDAMLAHEVGHLAGADPIWQWIADIASSVLWWHPLVWWTRRELREASEAAADEASLLVANGPSTLAECLVKLGNRLANPEAPGSLGIQGNGFRSNLGRRVEELFKLEGRPRRAPHRFSIACVKLVGPLSLAALAIVSAAWTSPSTFQKGETSMRTFRTTWQRSAALLAFAITTAPDPSVSGQNQTAGPKNETRIKSADVPQQSLPPDRMDPAMRARFGLAPQNSAKATTTESTLRIKAKLEKIVFDEIVYDSIPLAEVVKDLSALSRKNDPEKQGVNFLISNSRGTPARTDVDPVTGAPVQPSAPDLNNVNIRFNLPLRNVRLKDVLDALVRVAEEPIHYTLQNYGIVFSAGSTQESEPSDNPAWRMDPVLAARYGLLPSNAPAQIAPAPSKTAKLDQIVIDEIFFEGLPLTEVVKVLHEKSRQLDPAKKGINFLISNAPVQRGQWMIDPVTGIAKSAEERLDLYNLFVRFNLPLRNVRLKDVLDAITNVVERPLQYDCKEWGVVFAHGRTETGMPEFTAAPEGAPVEVRTFRIDASAVLKGLENTFGVKVTEAAGAPGDNTAATASDQARLQQAQERVENLSKKYTENHPELKAAKASLDKLKAEVATNKRPRLSRTDEIRLRQAEEEFTRVTKLREQSLVSADEAAKARNAFDLLKAELEEKYEAQAQREKAEQERPAQSRVIQQGLKRLFAQLGANMDHPNRAVFYNDATGIVMVRATAEELKVIQAAIETLGGARSESKRTVSVHGAVETHGPTGGSIELPPDQSLDILEAIAKAGGFASKAGKNPRIELVRKGSNKVSHYRFDELRRETDPVKKIWLEAGDTLYVPEPFF